MNPSEPRPQESLIPKSTPESITSITSSAEISTSSPEVLSNSNPATDSMLELEVKARAAQVEAETAKEHLDRAGVVQQPVSTVSDRVAQAYEEGLIEQISAK